MRVLLVNNFFVPRTTGSSHFSFDVARHYVKAGCEVTVVTTAFKDNPPEEEIDGIRVVRLPAFEVNPGRIAFNYGLPFATRPSVRRRLRTLLDEVRPDVIHQNGQFFDLTFLTTLASRKRRIPRVVTVHTPLIHTNPTYLKIIKAVDATAIRALNAIGDPAWVGVDKFVVENIKERYKPKPDRLSYIPATLRVDDFAAGDGTAIKERFGLGDSPVILSFGHVIPTRNRMRLIRALPGIVERFPDVKVLIVGQVYVDDFLDEARALGVADHLILTGRIDHHQVPDHIAVATVETHDLEGLGIGITTLEVMAAGVPTFAIVPHDNYPGMDLRTWPDLGWVESAEPEVVAHALCRLLADPAERQRTIDSQRRFVRELFSPEVVGQQYLDLFEREIARHR